MCQVALDRVPPCDRRLTFWEKNGTHQKGVILRQKRDSTYSPTTGGLVCKRMTRFFFLFLYYLQLVYIVNKKLIIIFFFYLIRNSDHDIRTGTHRERPGRCGRPICAARCRQRRQPPESVGCRLPWGDEADHGAPKRGRVGAAARRVCWVTEYPAILP